MPLMRRFSPIAAVAAALLGVLIVQPAHAKDETAESAVWLLEKATLVHKDGMHNILLRSLRQLEDPSLSTLFSALVQKQHPVLKIHGILALGEIDPKKQINLALLADVDPKLQGQLVSSAMEAGLLTTEQAKDIIKWPGLDDAVKVIVATKLVQEKQLDDQAILNSGMASDNLALKSMSALLKLELGDDAAMKHLEQLNLAEQTSRDNIRILLLQTALRYNFHSIAPWAMKIAEDPATPHDLSLLALRTAMRFDAPGAAENWERRYKSTTNPADRLRLSVLALDLATHLQPAMFDPLTTDTDDVVKQMGTVGKLLAQKQPADEAILKLLEMNNVLSSQWVRQYALEQPVEAARALLLGMIFSAEGGQNPPRFRDQRLENAILATQRLAEKDPTAAALIPDTLKAVPSLTQEAMLVGLIRAQVADARPLIAPVDKWANDAAEDLALLLRIKNGHQPNEEELKQLAMIVRGGARLQDPLRIQAAWLYLKLTDQDKVALASILGNR